MRDTAEVLAKLDLSHTNTKLLAIVANERGAAEACTHQAIHYLGYPFSISETFPSCATPMPPFRKAEHQKTIQDLCVTHDKTLVLYLSMGFGNPYGDPWNVEIVQRWVDELRALDIRVFSPFGHHRLFQSRQHRLSFWQPHPDLSRNRIWRPPAHPGPQLARKSAVRLGQRLPPLRRRPARVRRLPHGQRRPDRQHGHRKHGLFL